MRPVLRSYIPIIRPCFTYRHFSTEVKSGTSTKILCDIVGAKHYPHNEEIDMSMDTQVRLFDENETHIGNLYFFIY